MLRGAHPRTPIFVLSGQLSANGCPLDPVVARVVRDCALTYLSKPYRGRVLAEQIRDAVRVASDPQS